MVIAIYRVSLLLWATSWAFGSDTPISPSSSEYDEFVIKRAEPDNEALMMYSRTNKASPVLLHRDGRSFCLDRPDEILEYMLEFIDDQKDSTRLAVGIRARLARLQDRWKASS